MESVNLDYTSIIQFGLKDIAKLDIFIFSMVFISFNLLVLWTKLVCSKYILDHIHSDMMNA